jgi:ribonuclease P protein component
VLFYYKEESVREVAFIASKKVGKAHQRNFAKRRMRSLFLQHIDLLESGFYVFVAKGAILDEDFSKLQKSAKHALAKVGSLK